MDFIRIVLIGILSSWLLTSCSSMQPAAELPKNQSLSWGERVQVLSNIESWDLKGLIAIRSSAQNNSSWSANWQWRQVKNAYSISLVGPLGSGSMTLNGVPQRVTLETSDGKHFTASSAEVLLAQQLGWRLPVSDLFYWVRGLPVPNLSAEKQFDEYHHISQMRQDGWLIQFLRYTSVQHVDVPSKIYLTNPALNVKIIINQWQL